MSVRIVYLDTAGLWCLDALVRPADGVRDPRWPEYLAFLCDYLCDPDRDVRCIVPSAERLNGPLPAFYSALLEEGLMTRAEPISSEELVTSEADLATQFDEFMLHVQHAPKSPEIWYDLHNHETIRKGWQVGVPQQGKWPGVSLELESFLECNEKKRLEVAYRLRQWPEARTALTFSFVQRGFPYSRAAARRKAEYFTHPSRWMVLPPPEARDVDPLFGIAIGGYVCAALEEKRLERSATAVVKFLSGLRAQVLARRAEFRGLATVHEAKRLAVAMLPGSLAATPAVHLEKRTKAAVELLAASLIAVAAAPAGPTGSVAGAALGWLVSKYYLAEPLILSPTEAHLFRRWCSYSWQLEFPFHSCPRDGALLSLSGRCRVCDARLQQPFSRSAPAGDGDV